MGTTANWTNQTIFTGDNLDILRGMNSECVDLIYLDPPFNSNANYAAPIGSQAAGAEFKDTWGLNDINLAWHGLIKHEHPGLYDLLLAVRRIHGKSMMSYLIYMTPRLMEMRRVLKPTGSIYLHCDDIAGAYLRVIMDAVYGVGNYRNTITWKRTTSNNATKSKYGRNTDFLLFYSGEGNTWNQPYHERSETELGEYKEDERGRYKCENLTVPNGKRKFTWRGATPSASRGWKCDEHELEAMLAKGEIELRKDGQAKLRGWKRYLSNQAPGQKAQALWTDINRVGNTAKERVGYPTQKPLALLERIIRASSDPGDIVLDPFCGCATTCVAAERAERQWVGIDISSLAADLVRSRLRDELGLFYQGAHRSDIPLRTDLGDISRYDSQDNKKFLYGEQEGDCLGCGEHFPLRNFTIDHIIPQSKGGTDHLSNLQLLCGACNSTKGTETQEVLLIRLLDKGYTPRQRTSRAPDIVLGIPTAPPPPPASQRTERARVHHPRSRAHQCISSQHHRLAGCHRTKYGHQQAGGSDLLHECVSPTSLLSQAKSGASLAAPHGGGLGLRPHRRPPMSAAEEYLSQHSPQVLK